MPARRALVMAGEVKLSQLVAVTLGQDAYAVRVVADGWEAGGGLLGGGLGFAGARAGGSVAGARGAAYGGAALGLAGTLVGSYRGGEFFKARAREFLDRQGWH